MAGTIAHSSYTIVQFVEAMKDKSKIIRYPHDPNKKDNLNLQYKKSLYVCVKITLDKLMESNHLYASLAIHIIERYAYFDISCPIVYFLNYISTIKHDIDQILNESLGLRGSVEVFKSAISFLSTFSLVNYTTSEHSSFNYKLSFIA